MIKKKFAAIIASAALVCAVWGIAGAAEPGTQEDPLVSRSYVDQRISEVMRVLDSSPGGSGAANTEQQNSVPESNAAVGNSATFTAVLVEAGKTLFGGEGCELIMRTGSGLIVTSTDGIVNATSGEDLKNNVKAPKNSLLIIPRDDGRGIAVTEDAWFIVKGGYNVR